MKRWIGRALLLSLASALAHAAHAQVPTIVDGAEDRILLHGMVVAPDNPFVGDVLVEGNLITCVAASCAGQPGANGATQIDVQGSILPGLIDSGGFALFGVFGLEDWVPTSLYADHNQWDSAAGFVALLDAQQYLVGAGVDIDCEIGKYTEIKALVSGTTSAVGRVLPTGCFASLVRTIDIPQNDLGFDWIQVATSFPSTSSADNACANFASGTTTAYLASIGEGVNLSALAELTALRTVTTVDDCLLAPQTSIVHGTAFGSAEFNILASHGMGLVWTPRSDTRLYGISASIDIARYEGISRIALSTGWSISGSSNLLDELRFADDYDRNHFGKVLSSRDLFEMVTINAARVLGLGADLGSIEVGKRADLTVLQNTHPSPYESLLDSTPGKVRLVMVDGRVLFGDAALAAAGPAAPGCESMTIESVAKFLCVAEPSATNKLDQTYATISAVIDGAMATYDAGLPPGATHYGPATPLVASQICGNAQVEGAERCDDGDVVPGDGCSGVCALEASPIPVLGGVAAALLALALVAAVFVALARSRV